MIEPPDIDRPYVLLSCAMSADGYIDSPGPDRLLLSNDQDFDRVDAERAACDAILVGAGTLRRDNPRLLIRSRSRQRDRISRSLPPHPARVTLTESGRLDPSSSFFAGDGAKLVYCATSRAGDLTQRLGELATVVPAGDLPGLPVILADLRERGVRRLMVEGGSIVHTEFLTSGLADELQLVVAPFFVGRDNAPRFVREGKFQHGAERPMQLAEVRPMGDVVLLRYLLT
jgi:5-amino-6-(5-phosphoribosylamino)uracil reductase